MNYARKVLIAGTVFLFLLTGIVSAATPNVLFINWRGQTPCDAGLRDGLKDLGVAINIEDFNADQDKAKLEAFLSTIDEKKYAFIYTFGTTVSTKTAAKVKNTPILFGIVTNPVKSGLVQSWDKSGNNVTGVSHAIPIADQVEFILGLGQFEKIGMVFNPKEKNSQIANEELSKQLSAKGVSYASYPVESEGDIRTRSPG
jgi:putative ABC transport system substrate-binding protein